MKYHTSSQPLSCQASCLSVFACGEEFYFRLEFKEPSSPLDRFPSAKPHFSAAGVEGLEGYFY